MHTASGQRRPLGSVRVVGGAVTHFLWVSRTTARFRCRLEPGVRAPAPRAGPAPPAPRPPPARRAPSPARGARGARSGARRSAESGWRPPPPSPPSVPSRWPSLFHLPSLPGPAAALPSSLPSGPPRPARSARLPQAPLAARVPMDRRTDTCRWVRARARGGDERADAAPGVGGPFVWGAAALGSAPPPPRRPSGDPAEPSFCSSAGVGGRGRGKARVGAESRAAGRRLRRAAGGRETGRDPRRPGERRRRRGRGSGLSLRGRPAAGGVLSQRPRARCESGSPAPAPGSVGGGQEGGKGREKICSLSCQVSRRLREREGERCFQSSGPTCFPHARLAEVRFGACVKERASLRSLIYCF